MDERSEEKKEGRGKERRVGYVGGKGGKRKTEENSSKKEDENSWGERKMSKRKRIV